MNRAALWLGAAGIAVIASMPGTVRAAEPFHDVPTDHWAYQAVNNLQERGVVIGYPDGTFGGKRAMTRYEFAVAIDRLIDWVNKSIANIPKGGVEGLTEQQVRDMIDQRVRDLPTREDLDTIRRLANEFKDELATLGTNVDALRRDLDGLKARVGALEDRLNRFHFSGEANLIMRGERGQKATLPGNPSTRTAAIDLDSRADNNGTTNILENLKSLYSLDLGITGRVSSGVTANALFNVGNYLPWVNSNRMNPGVDSRQPFQGYATDQSTIPAVNTAQGIATLVQSPRAAALLGPAHVITQGNFGREASNTSFAEITPVQLNLQSPVRDLWMLKDVDVTVGKFGVQFTPYTLRQVDPDSYTNVTLTDNGDIITTGGKAHARIGGLHMTGYTGTHYNGRSWNSGDPAFISWGGPAALAPQIYGALPWDQSSGVHGTYQIGRFALGGTYITAGLSAPSGTVGSPYSNPPYSLQGNKKNSGRAMIPKRAEVVGANLAFPLFGKLGFSGEFAETNTLAGARVRHREGVYPIKDRYAWDGKLTWGVGRLSLAGGYKQIDPFFGAPGYWGSIGRWKNPTNIAGTYASAGYNFGAFSLKGSWENYDTLKQDLTQYRGAFLPNGAAVPISGNGAPIISDKWNGNIQHYTAGVSFNLNPSNDIDLGYETARIRPWDTPGARTREQYVTFGLGHRFNDSTGIKVLYQVVDYKDRGAGLYTVPGGAYKGGIGVTQLSVKF